jgi:hypothetical protein
MTPEEQLQLIDAVAETISDPSPEVRKEAFHCLLGLGLDGLARIVDIIDDQQIRLESKLEAVQALGVAFQEGRVDKTGVIKAAIRALEDCLGRENDALAEAAIQSLGEIGTQAILSKGKLLALLTSKKDNHRICVKVGSALLKISPLH